MTLDLQQAARDHLWLHFTRMGAYGDAEVPIIVRGDGCYLEDANGKRYLDALAGLFAVQIGYSYGDEIGQAALEQMQRAAVLHQLVVRASARDRARARGRAARAGRPEPRLLRLRRLGGGRVGVEARAPVPRGARRAPLEGDRRAAPRTTARRWARSRSTASPRCENAVRAARARRRSTCGTRTATTGRRRRPRRSSPRSCSTTSRQAIVAAGPGDGGDGDHGAGAERRRRVHAAGRLLPGRARDLRPLRDPALRRRGDHRLRPRSATGSARAKYDIRPDLITCAKGLSSAYASIGAVIATDQVFEPFLDEHVDVRARDHVRRPSRCMCAIALKNIEIMKRERIVENVRDERRRVPRHARAAARPRRSSATCAGRATSTRSSSSRTRRRARRSATRSARRCCAASSRRGCSSAG